MTLIGLFSDRMDVRQTWNKNRGERQISSDKEMEERKGEII
jgi:hypothetical protein